MMKRVRKSPVWTSSKYHTLFMLLDPKLQAYARPITVYKNRIFHSYLSNARHLFDISSSIFLKPRPVARANVTQKQYATLSNPKMYPHSKLWIPASPNIQILSGLVLSRTVAVRET